MAFPGTVIPLHVFEPRYRQLIKDCLEDERIIGVCHTQKTIRDAPKNQTASEMLSSNQATYQPQSVFSAGRCKLVDTTPDGRLIAEIHVEHRLCIKREKQTLPYRIVTCEQLEDVEESQDVDIALKNTIASALHPIIAKQDQEIADGFLAKDWSASEFSFGVFQYLRFDPDMMQQILETRTTHDRLTLIWRVIQNSD